MTKNRFQRIAEDFEVSSNKNKLSEGLTEETGKTTPKDSVVSMSLQAEDVIEKTKPKQITMYPSDEQKLKELKTRYNRQSDSDMIRTLINAAYDALD